tara:strand:- start:688 stop:987 length:300 start_codon:yes stop_codon:yes gene_type:complete
MSRKCVITGKGVMSGNNVSHAKNRTRRRFLPNLQAVSFFSEVLQRKVPMRVSANAVRTVEHNGGIDKFLLSRSMGKLSPELRKLRKTIEKAKAKRDAAA